MEKLTAIVPETKRTVIVKAAINAETVSFKTSNGKKMTVPLSSLLLIEPKAITYKFPKRKILKGNFKAVAGGMQDKDNGYFVATDAVVLVENIAPKKKGDAKAAVKKKKAK